MHLDTIKSPVEVFIYFFLRNVFGSKAVTKAKLAEPQFFRLPIQLN